jgi:hypothetical protein
MLKSKHHDTCEIGEWKDAIINPIESHIGRSSIYNTKEIWKNSSCRFESIVYSCHYHNNSNINQLEKRHWKSKCDKFSSDIFMNLLKRRKLLFFGDSIIHEIWSTLLCHIDGIDIEKSPITNIYPVYYNPAWSGNECPFGTSHCEYMAGINLYILV